MPCGPTSCEGNSYMHWLKKTNKIKAAVRRHEVYPAPQNDRFGSLVAVWDYSIFSSIFNFVSPSYCSSFQYYKSHNSRDQIQTICRSLTVTQEMAENKLALTVSYPFCHFAFRCNRFVRGGKTIMSHKRFFLKLVPAHTRQIRSQFSSSVSSF